MAVRRSATLGWSTSSHLTGAFGLWTLLRYRWLMYRHRSGSAPQEDVTDLEAVMSTGRHEGYADEGIKVRLQNIAHPESAIYPIRKIAVLIFPAHHDHRTSQTPMVPIQAEDADCSQWLVAQSAVLSAVVARMQRAKQAAAIGGGGDSRVRLFRILYEHQVGRWCRSSTVAEALTASMAACGLDFNQESSSSSCGSNGFLDDDLVLPCDFCGPKLDIATDW